MMPIDFSARDAWTSDENVATFPSTVTTQRRLPWPRMATTLSYYRRTMTINYTMHYFFTLSPALCLNVCHLWLLRVPTAFVLGFTEEGMRAVRAPQSANTSTQTTSRMAASAAGHRTPGS
jgi:hypothetical protein